MTLSALQAALADRYRLERELGAGGMATVYLARDLRHDRDVAIKVLRPELAAVIGAERFLAEIKTTANLQHPHILALHDSGTVNGTVFYVMPFVEGESLRDRLGREKQLPIAEAVRITTEVASALDYAHRHGVIHRDIKPENILLHDGQALVADFGIALAAARTEGGTRMTETGMSLGTPHYMSPEQAMGERDLDARTDVYALGCVAYEMLVGEPPFSGPTAQAIVAKVMTATPEPITNTRKTVPPTVEDAVHTALQKLPADRFATAKEFAEALGGATTGARRTSGIVRERPASTARWLRDWRSIAALAAVAILAVLATFGRRGGPMPSDISHHDYLGFPDSILPLPDAARTFALSPDGRNLVYGTAEQSVAGGGGRLVHKRLNQLVGTQIPGSANAKWPNFSPDGTQLVTVLTVFNVGALQTLPLAGGTPRVLVADSVLFGATWGADGYIYFSRVGSIQRIPEAGGPIDTLTLPQAGGGVNDRFPVPVPGGRAVLFARQQGSGANRVVALDLKTGEERDLVAGFPIEVISDGVLVYSPDGRRGNAVRFDLDRLAIDGEPLTVTPELRLTGFSIADLAVSRSGSMVYWSGARADSRVFWVDRRGGSHEVDPEWRTPLADTPKLSPDGRRLALSVANALVVKQLDRGPASRIVPAVAARNVLRPEWHPDGRSLLVYRTGGKDSVFALRDDGLGGLLPTVDDPRGVAQGIWSPDGRWMVYRTSVEAENAGDIFAKRLDSDEEPIPLVTSPGSDITPVLSPDGRWLAYASDESGTFEVYLRPFPNVNDRRVQVSVRGGWLPRWAHGSGELFFVGPDNVLTAVRVRTSPSLELGTPESLFSVTPYLFVTPFHQGYDVTADGQRFVMIGARGSLDVVRIDNWLADFPELRR